MSNLVLTEKRIVNDYPQMTWEIKEKFQDPILEELKILREYKRMKESENIILEAKLKKVDEISSFRKSLYFLSLAILELIVSKFPVFEIEFSPLLGAKLKIKQKEETLSNDPNNPNSDPKLDPSNPAERAKVMRAYKFQKYSEMNDFEKDKAYVLQRKQIALAVAKVELLIDGTVIKALHLPYPRHITSECKNELNQMLGSNYDHKFYTRFIQRFQNVLKHEGVDFFDNLIL